MSKSFETITKSGKSRRTVKRQGAQWGLYADCELRLEPNPGGGLVFESSVGVLDRFAPAIEAGVRQAAEHGVLQGLPVNDVKVQLFDGSYHERDSNDAVFTETARTAFREALYDAGPVIVLNSSGD